MAIELLNIDCMEYMRNCKDKEFDLAVVDPPYFKGVGDKGFYGKDFTKEGRRKGNYAPIDNWDAGIPDEAYYRELLRVSKHQIIWGINYYPFKVETTGRIVWDKKNDDSTFSNCEIASNSLIEHVKIYRYLWNGMLQEDMKNKEVRIHPTQKPRKLYKWTFEKYAKPEWKILDTHLGSASSAIEAYFFGCNFVGLDNNKHHFDNAVKRYNAETRQLVLAV